MELAKKGSANPDRLRATLEAAGQAWRERGGLPAGFFTSGNPDIPAEITYTSAGGHEKIQVCGQLAPGLRPSEIQVCGQLQQPASAVQAPPGIGRVLDQLQQAALGDLIDPARNPAT